MGSCMGDTRGVRAVIILFMDDKFGNRSPVYLDGLTGGLFSASFRMRSDLLGEYFVL